MHEDRSSWSIKDIAVAEELIALLDLTPADRQALAALQEQAKAAAPAMTEEFYARILSHPNANEYVQGLPMQGLHSTLTGWFTDLFSGQYDAEYANKRLVIGRVHVRIGLPVRYPLAMLDIISKHGERLATPAGEQALSAFRKILALDIAVFNQAYEDNQLQHLSDLMGNERLARRLLQGNMS